MRVLAVDLGATSVRVAAVDLAAPTPQVEIVHRRSHAPVEGEDGAVRWDWRRLVGEVELGLERALAAGPAASIGVDGWGVDYGLVGPDGTLVAPPFSYRDRRTSGWKEIAERIGTARLYEVTGVQLMAINTIFQLAVHRRDELERAERAYLLPDLLVNRLTGHSATERSNASTTGLLDARTGEWSAELMASVGLDPALFPRPQAAGSRAGAWRGVPLHLVGSHDTASAFLAMPAGGEPGTVFVSTGTWVIVGIERARADTSSAANTANFSNEAGAFGGFRFLKNVMGFWMLEQCRPRWGNPDFDELLAEAEGIVDAPVFDARDDRFLNPVDMEAEIRAAAGLRVAPRGIVVRSIVESIAAGIGSVVDEIASVTGITPRRLGVVGGGARMALLHRALRARTGLDVLVGSPEATALGNALAQGIALGTFADVDEARRYLATEPVPHVDPSEEARTPEW